MVVLTSQGLRECSVYHTLLGTQWMLMEQNTAEELGIQIQIGSLIQVALDPSLLHSCLQL